MDGPFFAALLSTTFLNAIDADDILIPMFTWKVESTGGDGGGGAGAAGAARWVVVHSHPAVHSHPLHKGFALILRL